MRQTSQVASLLLATTLLSAVPVTGLSAQVAAPAGVEKVAEVEGISEYRLDNGLRVVLFPDPSAPQVTVNITYLVGSRFEGYGETGMAHLLEHMLFKGSPRHRDIPQELTEHGAQPNGTTWYDRTNYFETFVASEENLEWALDLEADRMVNSFVSAEDLASEMTVVRNEFESGENSPFGVLMERTLSTAYLWQNYGHSTIGARSDIENVPIERLQAFYHKYYQPDNAVLVIAGKFDQTDLLDLVEEKFGEIPKPDRTQPGMILYPTYTEEPAQDGERVVHLRRVGDTQLVMVNHHVAPGSHPDYAATEILNFVLSDNPSGRLYKALVETGKAASVGSLALQLKEASPLLQYAEVRTDGDLEAAEEAMLAVYDGLTDEPITDQEVERARTSLLKNIELSLNNSRRIALSLSEWIGMGDWRLLFLNRDRLGEVTTAQVNDVARRYLVPSNRTIGFFHPTQSPLRAEVPDPPDVEALVKDYQGRAAVAEAEAFEPTPANVEARVTRVSLGDTGFKVALLPKETRGDQVVVTFRLLFGDEGSLQGQSVAGSLAGAMLMRGTTEHTREQLQDAFDQLKAQVSIGGSASQATGSITTTRDNLPAVLELVKEVLHQPAFDPDEFQQLKEGRLASYESQLSEPQAIAGVTLQRHLSPYPAGHPYYVPTFQEEIDGLNATNLEEAKAFYERFYGASRGHMAIVGDFDPDQVVPVIEDTFGDWVASTPWTARIPTRYFDAEPVDEMVETPDKANAIYLAGLNLPIGESHSDYPALTMANYMLGGGFLNSRLATRIRRTEGLSYGVGSGISLHPIDETGTFQMYAIYAPENVRKLEQAFVEVLQQVMDDGFTAEELAAAKTGYLQSRQVGRGNDRGLAGQLSQDLYLDRTMEWDTDFERRVEGLTVEEVNAAFRRWIDPSKLSIVKAGDFKKAGVTEQ